MLKGENLTRLYKTVSDVYRDKVGGSFSFQTGEKKRVKHIFVYTAEAMGIRDKAKFDEVLHKVELYLGKKTEEWLKWRHKSRANYLGFLDKRQEVELFIAGLQAESKPDVTKIAGVETSAGWEDWG